MSNENIKTWPEVAYCDQVDVDVNSGVPVYCPDQAAGFWVQEESTNSTVKYIRADIAVEREKKLIEKAFDNGIIAVLDQIRYAEHPVFCPKSDVEAAYYQSGLEKLK